jgi:menaquinone-dependent protoporphyrinogen IX oxidase
MTIQTRILIAYASRFGSTRDVAGVIGLRGVGA